MKQFIFVFVVYWNVVVSYDLSTYFVKKWNSDYRGNNIRSTTNQMSYEECRTQCSQNDECHVFTWDLSTQICYLNSNTDSDGQSDLSDNSGRRQGKRGRYEKLKFFRVLVFLVLRLNSKFSK